MQFARLNSLPGEKSASKARLLTSLVATAEVRRNWPDIEFHWTGVAFGSRGETQDEMQWLR